MAQAKKKTEIEKSEQEVGFTNQYDLAESLLKEKHIKIL